MATAAVVLASYAAGWNLVSGPAGSVIAGNTGALYTYQTNDASYEVIPNGAAFINGQGYWAYFDGGGTQTIASGGPLTLNIPLPAGQWIMVGNPSAAAATITGADIVYTLGAGGYQAVTALGPGAGAWAYSANGGTAVISGR